MSEAQPSAGTEASPGERGAGGQSGESNLAGALTVRGAQQLVDRWMQARGWAYWQPLAQLARMTEELGELARIVNHLYGEKPKKPDEAEQDLALELADLLYTMLCLANSQGVDLQTALERVLAKYGVRDAGRYAPAPERPQETVTGPPQPASDWPAPPARS